MVKDKKLLLEELEAYIAHLDAEKAKTFLNDLQPVDIAEIIEELELKEQQWILSLLDSETAALVLNELDPELGGELLGHLNEERAGEILEEMSFDDAADLLSELSDQEQNKYLELLESEDQQDVRELMTYREDTAGGLMTTEYVAVREDITAARAIEVLREIAPDAETVYYVYVINLKNQLVGVISLRELIIANPDSLIRDIMRRKVVSVPVDMDQEEVARIVTKYNFLAVPVIDHDNSLLGIITVDDVIDVIHEEAAEDLYRLAGAAGEEEEEEEEFFQRIFASLKARLPWLFITMLGGLVSGRVLSGFSEQIDAVVALAFFIPLLTGMGGNVGTQSSTVTVRGIATGQIKEDQIFTVVLRESLVGAAIGSILGLIVGVIASVWQQKPMLGIVVGLAMLGNMLTAATMGTLVPLIFRRIGIDPAVASAPFISTAIDITGLLIYSTLATLLIAYLL
ncbi:magnesium transporter [Thermanaerosceptrum fracticalcis]|uniref:Magnesium transporter MgtE n=1 Tax=Thermanaerosceptrum fracticalcis TaxID=1712410 RepID=A0A7G6E222_THEFR|nr:magnesium transporter [Thermanaerosceptrum fracticalcis]QNB46126.1 magnesium transporter [Thermanaerosceptrum fracticalcis]